MRCRSDLPAVCDRRLSGTIRRHESVGHRYVLKVDPNVAGARGRGAHRSGSMIVSTATAGVQMWRPAMLAGNSSCTSAWLGTGGGSDSSFFLGNPTSIPIPLESAVAARAVRKSPPAYSIAAVNEFDPCSTTCTRLRGPGIDRYPDPRGRRAQMEINLLHGYPMGLADSVLFKRNARERLAPQNVCTFMQSRWPRAGSRMMHQASSTRRPAEHIQQ